MLRCLVVVFVGIVVGASLASETRTITDLFPAGDSLRYKSCQLSLQTTSDGYEISVRRDCPSNQCSWPSLRGKIEVNSEETQVGLKKLQNYHRLEYDASSTTLVVREFIEWDRSLFDLSGGFGGGSKTIGYQRITLKMRINNDTGEIEELATYKQFYRRPGLLGTTRNLFIGQLKKKWIDCESPAPSYRRTLVEILGEDAPIKGWPQEPVSLTTEEKADLEEILLSKLPAPDPDEYTQRYGMGGTPLHYAAYHGLENFARQLIWILNGLDLPTSPLNYLDWDQRVTPLYFAVAQGQLGMVKLLLASKGIDVTAGSNNQTPKELALSLVEQCSGDRACKIAQEIAQLFEQH